MRSAYSEIALYEQIAQYIALQYPDVVPLIHFDLAGVNNPSMYTRALYGRLNRRAWPDLFIAKSYPVGLGGGTKPPSAGLFLELKREGTKVKRKNGSWSSPHIEEQAGQLDRLRDAGYYAEFAVGFDEAQYYIDAYLNPARFDSHGAEVIPPDEVPF